MPNNEELLKLAERCEAASGPDRELDVAVHEAIGLCHHMMTVERIEVEIGEFDLVGRCVKCGSSTGYAPKPYTKSVDAAMTLVPEPQSFTISHCGNTCARVQIIGGDPCSNDPEFDGDAATPALALTAAALRARAAA